MSRRWAVIDCGKYPSENNCQVVMKAPEDRLEDLLDASLLHVCDKHGGHDDAETREMLRSAVEYMEG